MPCYNPLRGWKSRTPSENGGRAIVFDIRKGYADMPMTVSCGQCIGCRLERSRQWAMRCVHEASLWKRSCFITLTYDDVHLPKNRSLVLDEFQRFMKRLRKSYQGFEQIEEDGKLIRPIRFFHCGEYGEKNGRPHYHAIIFNFDFEDKQLFKSRGAVRVYVSRTLMDLWPYGFSTVGDCTFESAAYVARYVLKKVTGEKAAEYYGVRRPDYVTMSRRPGIAARWYDDFKHEVYDDGDFIVLRGKKMKPPRFYDSRLKVDSPEIYEFIKRSRRSMACVHEDDNTSDRLAVKEKVKAAQLKFLPRTL